MIEQEYFSIQNLIKTNLPPLPASVMRVSALLADEEASPNSIATAVSLDPILSARLLRIANSPIYGFMRNITSLVQAVSRVGNNQISEMLMVSGISDSFGRKVLNSPAGKDIWSHLLATALATSEICRYEGMRGADDAFSCGLLHDIGKLILLRADMPLYSKLLERAKEEGDLNTIEIETFGFDHAELGAEAAVAWKLSGALCHMIRHHHQPKNATSGVAMVRIVNLADKFVNLRTAEADMTDFYFSQPFIDLDLETEVFDAIWDHISVRLMVAETCYNN